MATTPTEIDPKKFALNEKDTGSADVQIATMSKRINHLTQHLLTHRKDFSSRRGLLVMVAQRRRLLDYLRNTAPDRYAALIKGLGLRR